MIRRPYVKSALIAAAIGTQLFSTGMTAAYAQSQGKSSASASASVPPANENAARQEVGKPLLAAQDLTKAGKYAEALAKIAEADAVPNKSAYESYLIERVRGPVAYAAGDDAQASKSLEAALKFERIAPDEKKQVTALLANIYFRMKDYPKAIATATKYMADGGNDQNVPTILARSYYLTNDFTHAAQVLRTQVQAEEGAGKKPEEIQLKLLASSLLKLNDRAAYGDVLEKLVSLYPNKDYWADLLARMFSKQTFADRLTLDGYRLKMVTSGMEEAKEYLDMSELAMRAGFPAEAKKTLDAGFQAGLLGTGADAAKHKRLRDAAAKAAADDQKTMAQGEAAALKKKDGTGLVNLGYAYVTVGQFDKGISLMERGLQHGGLKHPEEAKLHLALAYAQAGKKAEAIEKLKSVQGNDGTSDLAHYWTLYLKQPG